MRGHVSFNVLFVCAANVCRSPTAVRVFAGALTDSTEFVRSASSGVWANGSDGWCPAAQRWIGKHKVVVEDVRSRPPRQLTTVQMEHAGLIVAVDPYVKAAAVRIDLQARNKVFTLVEAVALAEAVRATMARQSGAIALELQPPPRPGQERMAWLVQEMNAARGLVPVPSSRRGLDPLDPHDPQARTSHRRSLRNLTEQVQSLAASLESVAQSH